jgi:hypothetical protein
MWPCDVTPREIVVFNLGSKHLMEYIKLGKNIVINTAVHLFSMQITDYTYEQMCGHKAEQNLHFRILEQDTVCTAGIT